MKANPTLSSSYTETSSWLRVSPRASDLSSSSRAFPHGFSIVPERGGEGELEADDHFPTQRNDERKTVLVVEDDARLREIEAFTLSNLGYNVLQAGDMEQGMKFAASTTEIHLLITDYSMPGGNGMELARSFRSLHPGTPVLLVSSLLRAVFGRVHGFDRFETLPKPFTFDELVDKVNGLISEKTLPDPLEL